ncbi:MAG: hypothetical protein M5U12_27560 [Verrucomicrobia bacterium]|nr:hypothetical protein [Verrucomicrobiota bacterium]
MIDTAAFAGRVEFAPTFAPRPGITHVLFDFDGTLSLIRQGWPDVMVPLFAELLPPLPGESGEDRCRLAFEDIMRLNGKQTIYQMIQLAERIRERGGTPGDPLAYKHEYLRRLDERIRERVEALAGGDSGRMISWCTGPGPCSTSCSAAVSTSIWPAARMNPTSNARRNCWA